MLYFIALRKTKTSEREGSRSETGEMGSEERCQATESHWLCAKEAQPPLLKLLSRNLLTPQRSGPSFSVNCSVLGYSTSSSPSVDLNSTATRAKGSMKVKNRCG
uniref:Uncharacterized protein n=1 Tax=Nelumbo nucifera TaxID=4432 RepID=A0A822Z252_NELNU|nr:TPA_asm: hypothetical protein HUJ06_008402 [Nelumbo nucifera]